MEAYLTGRVRALGGLCIKVDVRGDSGWPDRVVLLPHGLIGFLELKRPGERPRPLQVKRIEQLQAIGFVADWADSAGAVERFLQRLQPMDYLDGPVPMPV